MPSLKIPALENEIAQAVVTAAAAAVTTYVRPARFPRWVRRGVSMSNTLTAVGAAMAGDRKPARSRLAGGEEATTVELVDGKPTSKAGANVLSASAAGMALVTSGMAMRLDRIAEKALIKRGVRNPRLWLAAGAAVVSLASPWVTKQIQKSTASLQEKAMSKQTLTSTLANPLGTNSQTSTSANEQIEAGDPSRRVISDQGEGENSDENPTA